eukprot:jgi/Orpsp1_1/1181002/evm.model.c7180000075463.1
MMMLQLQLQLQLHLKMQFQSKPWFQLKIHLLILKLKIHRLILKPIMLTLKLIMLTLKPKLIRLSMIQTIRLRKVMINDSEAEVSDDYGDKKDKEINNNTVDSMDSKDVEADKPEEETNNTDNNNTTDNNNAIIGAAAAGTAGAAAGIFLWIKRSKQNKVEKVDTLSSQFNLA